MGRAPCCDKANVKRGPWSPEEDATLKSYLQAHGTGGNWIALPKKAGLRRCGKSCRLRWLNYLRPDIKHGGFTDEEDRIICNLYNQMGGRWSVIASQLPGRTDNDVKNYWNTKLKKKLLAGKISPTTNSTTNGQLLIPANCATLLPGPITKPSALQIPSSPCLPKVETFDSSFFPNSDIRNSAASRIQTDIDNSGLTFYDHRSFRLQHDPKLIDFSADQFHHVRTKNSDINSNNVTMPQEGSSNISDSSLQASSDVKRPLVAPDNGCDEYTGHGSSLMDFGFGSPCDIVDFWSFEEKADNYHDPTCCISLSDLAFEIRPHDQRLNQSIINDYPRN